MCLHNAEAGRHQLPWWPLASLSGLVDISGLKCMHACLHARKVTSAVSCQGQAIASSPSRASPEQLGSTLLPDITLLDSGLPKQYQITLEALHCAWRSHRHGSAALLVNTQKANMCLSDITTKQLSDQSRCPPRLAIVWRSVCTGRSRCGFEDGQPPPTVGMVTGARR